MNRFFKFALICILAMSFIIADANASMSILYSTDIPEHTLYSTAALGDQYVLYDVMGYHYYLYRGETLLGDIHALTNLESNKNGRNIYRSALCVVSDEQSFYGIEMNLDENYNTSTVKFHARNDSTWLAINNANSPISSLRRSIWLVSSINGSDINATTQA